MPPAIEGVGLGMRWAIVDDLLEEPPPELRWLEVTPENYMRRGGRFPAGLERCLSRWPAATHGLSLSLGGFDPFDESYVRMLSDFIRRVESPWHSDHLCFSSAEGVVTHDLLPLPYTQASVSHVSDRISRIQDRLKVPLAVENISAYLIAPHSEMSEADFIRQVVDASGCLLLLDINNLYVNSRNHRFDMKEALERLPLGRVPQIHIAGHAVIEGMRIDTHAENLSSTVLHWLEQALAKTGPVPILLERDDNFPPWPELCAAIASLDGYVRRGREERA